MNNERRLADGRVELIDTQRVQASLLYNEDLAPVPLVRRNWTTYNYAALRVSMAHCIPTYMLASGLLASGMNWSQALVTILLGNTIVLIPILLNSHPGTKYGIPFPVFARAAYGTLGSNVPALMRALVACGWFGIQAWIGGEALQVLFRTMMPAWPTLLGVGFLGHTTTEWISFLLFWGLNVAIIYRGMDLVREVENWAAPYVLVMTGVLLMAYGGPDSLDDVEPYLKDIRIPTLVLSGDQDLLISNEFSREMADAILVGRKTVADDNPELTCRLPGLEARSPRRVILDAQFRTPPTARMFKTAEHVPVTIFGDTKSTPPPYPKGVEVRRMPAGADGRLSLEVVLESLGAEGVTRVLVEGGPTIAGAFLAADLVDEVVIGHGTEALGSYGRMPAGDQGLEFLSQAERWQMVDERRIGADRLSVHRRTGRFASEPTP